MPSNRAFAVGTLYSESYMLAELRPLARERCYFFSQGEQLWSVSELNPEPPNIRANGPATQTYVLTNRNDSRYIDEIRGIMGMKRRSV